MLPAKFNLGRWPSGLKFRMVGLPDDQRETILTAQTHLDEEEREALGEQLYRVEWLGATDISADEAVSGCGKKGPKKPEQAAEWLRAFLKEYAYPSDEILAAAKAAGFTFDNIKEAKIILKTEGLRNHKENIAGGVWWSGFGEPDAWKRRPNAK